MEYLICCEYISLIRLDLISAFIFEKVLRCVAYHIGIFYIFLLAYFCIVKYEPVHLRFCGCPGFAYRPVSSVGLG